MSSSLEARDFELTNELHIEMEIATHNTKKELTTSYHRLGKNLHQCRLPHWLEIMKDKHGLLRPHRNCLSSYNAIKREDWMATKNLDQQN